MISSVPFVPFVPFYYFFLQNYIEKNTRNNIMSRVGNRPTGNNLVR